MASTFTHVTENYLPDHLATKLHTIDVWHRSEKPSSKESRWVVFIHGGAWRDPDITALDFVPTIEVLKASPIIDSIAGFASINYRLSSYPNHPTNPSSPDDPSRNAVHKDHVRDVERALQHLLRYYLADGEYHSEYLLVGHSAGATMAFQILAESDYPHPMVPTPTAILGVEGIYDLEELVKSFERIPVYREFIANAFEDDTILWKRASPTSKWKPALWEAASALIIAHSDDDELVDQKQADLMLECVRQDPKTRDKAHFLKAHGGHDEIVTKGYELARLIEEALGRI